MDEAIKNFPNQFGFEPEIINREKLGNYKHFIVGGMGGSHLAAAILKMYEPGVEVYVHRSYDLPPFSDEFLKGSLLIGSSYSGNTEETISFIELGYARGLDVAVISTGGKLIDFAKNNSIPYIQIPDTGIQPRCALGFSSIALAKMIDHDRCLAELKKMKDLLKPLEIRKQGEEIARVLKGKVPIIYSSLSNLGIVYNWKIKLNETGKIPAFYNVFPELNHNEMNGMDVIDSTRSLSANFHVVILKDSADHPQISKRMDIVQDIYEKRGIPVLTLELSGSSTPEKAFNSILLADWVAYSIAVSNGAEPEAVPLIEEFKKKMEK